LAIYLDTTTWKQRQEQQLSSPETETSLCSIYFFFVPAQIPKQAEASEFLLGLQAS
jgi:hypothetical protein